MALITLTEAKLQLNRTSTTDDTEIQSYIDALDGVVEAYIRGPVSSTAYTEWHDGGRPDIWLHKRPVVSVTSVTEYSGTTGTVLTSQPLDGGSFTASGYVLDSKKGQVTRTSSGTPTCFANGSQNVKVVYNAGYASVPAPVNLAARIILQHLWETQRGSQGAVSPFEGGEIVVMPGVGYALPNRAKELLQPYRRILGPA